MLDAFDAVTDFILLEDDQGELIMEFAEVRASQILLEEGDGTFGGIGAAGSILTEDGDYVVLEDEETELPFSMAHAMSSLFKKVLTLILSLVLVIILLLMTLCPVRV